MAERYDSVEYYKDEDDARRAMAAVLTGPTPKMGYRGPGRTPSIKRPNFGSSVRYPRAKPEKNSDWTSYTDFQDYKPPPTDYSYLDNPPTWGG